MHLLVSILTGYNEASPMRNKGLDNVAAFILSNVRNTLFFINVDE